MFYDQNSLSSLVSSQRKFVKYLDKCVINLVMLFLMCSDICCKLLVYLGVEPGPSVQCFNDLFGFWLNSTNVQPVQFDQARSKWVLVSLFCTWTLGVSVIEYYPVGPNCQVMALLWFRVFVLALAHVLH